MRQACLTIFCGLPGSGKTTLAKELEAQNGAIRMCPDEWIEAVGLDQYDEPLRARIEALQWTLSQKLLSQGTDVIIEWGTWARSERDQLREGARAIGARVELRYLHASTEVLFERIQKRNFEVPPITWEALLGWCASFEAPTEEEFALFD